jgi:hypothetical protein
LNLDTGINGGNINLVIAGKTVEALPGTKLRVAIVDNGMAISVSEGSALLIEESGHIIDAEAGTVLALAFDGTELDEIPEELFFIIPSERFEIDEELLPEIEVVFREIAPEPGLELVLEEEPEPVIEVIPLLPAPRLIQPAAGFNINLETFQQMNNIITFRWSPVQDANAYIFTLYHQTTAGRRQIIRLAPQRATTWTLRDLRLLDRGTFIWRVEAVQITGNQIAREGETAENHFIMNIPTAGGVQLQTPGVLYGN